ncbi:MAG: 4-hydroxybenzoate decarboxylase, partial [Candidatus Eisenbacteria bacterium]|nr:4-hydroxybenzoate decarboxylase [Candidatus Eisenbacteria bacterium]
FGTANRVLMAFGEEPRQTVARAAQLPQTLVPPTLVKLWSHRDLLKTLSKVGMRRVSSGPVRKVKQNPPVLSTLPALKTWEQDGGPFITLPLVYTEHPEGHGSNLGMYRIQIYDDATTGIHWQIGKGGGFHYQVAEKKNQALPVNIIVGGPPALILGAIAPLPENVPELLLASLLAGKRLPLADNPAGPLPLVSEAEFVLVGEVPPNERRLEGPFGDHYGYYSLEHEYPVFHCHTMYHREDAIFPATVVGKPRQEDFFIGDFLQELLSPIFPVVMPAVEDLWSYGETGYHSLSAAVVKSRYKRESMASAFRILGEGQLSLTKFLLVMDKPQDLKNFKSVLTHVLERADFRTDLYIFGNLSMDTLDYSGTTVNEGSKGVLLGVGDPIRDLPHAYEGDLPVGINEVAVFCPGCLVISGPTVADDPHAGSRVVQHPGFREWPMIVLVDRAEEAARSSARFLWTTFTRFEPAADIHSAEARVIKNHVAYETPVLIDARLKPHFPEELFCDPETAKTVSERWKEYFPSGQVAMGESDTADLDRL